MNCALRLPNNYFYIKLYPTENISFSVVKRAEHYDYDFQLSANKVQIKDLCSLRFIQNKENILFYRTPGVGTTHLAIAIRVQAAGNRYLRISLLAMI